MSKREKSCEIKNAKYGRRKRMMKRLKENEKKRERERERERDSWQIPGLWSSVLNALERYPGVRR